MAASLGLRMKLGLEMEWSEELLIAMELRLRSHGGNGNMEIAVSSEYLVLSRIRTPIRDSVKFIATSGKISGYEYLWTSTWDEYLGRVP